MDGQTVEMQFAVRWMKIFLCGEVFCSVKIIHNFITQLVSFWGVFFSLLSSISDVSHVSKTFTNENNSNATIYVKYLIASISNDHRINSYVPAQIKSSVDLCWFFFFFCPMSERGKIPFSRSTSCSYLTVNLTRFLSTSERNRNLNYYFRQNPL